MKKIEDIINKVHCADCLEFMKDIPDKSVDLVIADPPYNIKKAEWDNLPNYIEWLGNRLLEIQRILKDNGSIYLFHNDFLQMVEIQNWINQNSKFVFKRLIVWNKKFKGYWNQLNAIVESKQNRNYSKQAEYILFYTFQDETGLTTIMLDTNNFTTLRQYFKDYQEALGLNLHEINRFLGHRKAEHCFYWKTTQWDLPTKETYQELYKIPLKYEFVCREYEDLRREYESLRYTFNNQKTHHSIWNYEIAKQEGHITPKPIPLIKNILRHSSNEKYVVLDPFLGSGTTAVACKMLKRNFIGIEISPEYCKIANERLRQNNLL